MKKSKSSRKIKIRKNGTYKKKLRRRNKLKKKGVLKVKKQSGGGSFYPPSFGYHQKFFRWYETNKGNICR